MALKRVVSGSILSKSQQARIIKPLGSVRSFADAAKSAAGSASRSTNPRAAGSNANTPSSHKALINRAFYATRSSVDSEIDLRPQSGASTLAGPPAGSAEPFLHIFHDYSGGQKFDLQQMLALHGIIIQAISGRGPLRCSDEFVQKWSAVLQLFFNEMPDIRRFSQVADSIFEGKRGAWDRDIKNLLWTASTMFGSLSRVYMNTSQLLYQVYRAVEERESEKPHETFLSKLEDDTYLPTYKEVASAFGLPFPNPPSKDRAYRSNSLAEYLTKRKQACMDRVARLSAETGKTLSPSAIDSMSVDETFQLLDPMEVYFHPYNYFCSRKGHSLFITQELVDSLAAHIEAASNRMVQNKEVHVSRKLPVVLEVGAGNGRLSYFLNQKLAGKVSLKSTDAKKSETETSGHIIELDEKLAVEKLRPDIVLCSFMPSGADWPAGWRQIPSVKEYILIGETTSGAVGNPWKTFGERARPHGQVAIDSNVCLHNSVVPPFEKEGWQKTFLHDVSENVLGCYDTLDLYGRACAVSFTRGPAGK